MKMMFWNPLSRDFDFVSITLSPDSRGRGSHSYCAGRLPEIVARKYSDAASNNFERSPIKVALPILPSFVK
jgi:hypothetical protein